jgi:hypothetical protein
MVKPESQSNEPPRDHKKHKSDKGEMYLWKVLCGIWKYIRDMFLTEKSAAWTMVFTLFLTVFTFLLYCVARSTDKILRIQERPWVEGYEFAPVCLVNSADLNKRLNLFFTDAPDTGIGGTCPFRGEIFKNAKPTDQFFWWVDVANTGKTPAVATRLNAARCVSKMPDKTPPSLLDCFNQSQDGQLVPPRNIYPHDAEIIKPQYFSLTAEEISDINRGNRFLYIRAHTEYSELDGTRHFKNFCWRYNPYLIYALRFCEGGNEDDTGKGQ